jgi:hypothetical protein
MTVARRPAASKCFAIMNAPTTAMVERVRPVSVIQICVSGFAAGLPVVLERVPRWT